MQPRKKAAIAWSVLQKCVRSELWFSFFQSTKKALFSAFFVVQCAKCAVGLAQIQHIKHVELAVLLPARKRTARRLPSA